jgi:hypothetical protein
MFEKYSEGLGEYGARPNHFPDAEDSVAIINWLVEEFKSLPELIGSVSDFASVFCSESLLKLLEIKDCADLGKFCSSGLEFPSASSVSMIRVNGEICYHASLNNTLCYYSTPNMNIVIIGFQTMRPCYYRILASYNQISASNTCIWT